MIWGKFLMLPKNVAVAVGLEVCYYYPHSVEGLHRRYCKVLYYKWYTAIKCSVSFLYNVCYQCFVWCHSFLLSHIFRKGERLHVSAEITQICTVYHEILFYHLAMHQTPHSHMLFACLFLFSVKGKQIHLMRLLNQLLSLVKYQSVNSSTLWHPKQNQKNT